VQRYNSVCGSLHSLRPRTLLTAERVERSSGRLFRFTRVTVLFQINVHYEKREDFFFFAKRHDHYYRRYNGNRTTPCERHRTRVRDRY